MIFSSLDISPLVGSMEATVGGLFSSETTVNLASKKMSGLVRRWFRTTMPIIFSPFFKTDLKFGIFSWP